MNALRRCTHVRDSSVIERGMLDVHRNMLRLHEPSTSPFL